MINQNTREYLNCGPGRRWIVGWMDGWMDGWTDRWIILKLVLWAQFVEVWFYFDWLDLHDSFLKLLYLAVLGTKVKRVCPSETSNLFQPTA
jgi:hypothetical protein